MLSTNESVPNNDVQRWNYDLTHYSHTCGNIGGLQTISIIPTLPGDSFDITCKMQFKLSPLVRSLSQDAIIDMYAFWVPHRHIYSNWKDFLQAGQDEAVNLGTDVMVGALQCCGLPMDTGDTVPRWLSRGYVQIYNNYFVDPQTPGDQVDEDTFSADYGIGEPEIAYGLPVCHLKRLWNTGITTTLTTADYRFALDGGEVSLYDMAETIGRLKTEQSRDWYALQRYRDILNYSWHTQVNIDADQRPELVMRSTQWLSGQEVNGADDATLGTYTGKSSGLMSLQIPTKFFPEHGALWIMAVLRIPPVIENECGYLATTAEPTYADISGDPDVIKATPPVELNANQQFSGGPNTVLGNIPFAHWYRELPHLVHVDYLNSAGHPFINNVHLDTRAHSVYVQPDLYDAMFQSTQMRHWQMQGYVDVEARRYVPKSEDSIFAGVFH